MLNINGLTIKVADGMDVKTLVAGVDLPIGEERIVGLVGGSGSGKTTTGLAILRLLSSQLNITSGKIDFLGKDLLACPEKELRRIRGKDISMVFQEPLNAFNPVFTISQQIGEVLKYHTKLTRRQRKERIEELLNMVGIKDPVRVCRNYPHQLSGGMRQRAMIAQAIAANPKLIIADEPTSNLDVTLQARIIELFRSLRADLKLSILLITHDLGLVAHLADEVAVMQQGKIVETGATRQVLENPSHAYTKKLMEVVKI